MVRAHEPCSTALLFEAYSRATMTAYVDKCIDLIVSASNDDDGLTGDVEDEKVTGLGYLAVVANIEPRLQEYALHFLLEHLGAPVKALFQGVSRPMRGY
jgi:hypothetical protein